MIKNSSVHFTGSFDSKKSCVKLGGNGSAEVIIKTDAKQVASVFPFITQSQDCNIEVSFKKLPGSYPNGSEKEVKQSPKRPKIYR